MSYINVISANNLQSAIQIVLDIKQENNNNPLYFRGEKKDYGCSSLNPSIYRDLETLKKEHEFYREMQRFNDQEFSVDRTAFDKLSRMQHYNTPTRMLDISEDLMSALYFALENKKDDEPAILYIFEIDKQKIKYYDSDVVSVIANLAKTPLENEENPSKSKKHIASDASFYIDARKEYNRESISSKRYLLHDIKEEKPYFEDLIDPKHIFSVQCVKPKFTNQRIQGQKGAFLLFGLNKENIESSIKIMENNHLSGENHPVVKLTKIELYNILIEDLNKLGITKPFIYPELEKVSEYLKRE